MLCGFAGNKLKEIRDSKGGAAIGVIGSNTTTNEENYLLQKFARTILRTNNIDHERTADYVAFGRAMAGAPHRAASLRDVGNAPAILLIGGNPTEEHPLLAWEIRTNVRLNKARLYIAHTGADQTGTSSESDVTLACGRLREDRCVPRRR